MFQLSTASVVVKVHASSLRRSREGRMDVLRTALEKEILGLVDSGSRQVVALRIVRLADATTVMPAHVRVTMLCEVLHWTPQPGDVYACVVTNVDCQGVFVSCPRLGGMVGLCPNGLSGSFPVVEINLNKRRAVATAEEYALLRASPFRFGSVTGPTILPQRTRVSVEASHFDTGHDQKSLSFVGTVVAVSGPEK